MHIMRCTQHYNAFQRFIVITMKTYGNKADLILSYVYIIYVFGCLPPTYIHKTKTKCKENYYS